MHFMPDESDSWWFIIIKCDFALQKDIKVLYKEAECYKIDTVNQKVHCKSIQNTNAEGKEEFTVDYDYLVIAMGARANTFNTPGVVENAHFLKVISLIKQ